MSPYPVPAETVKATRARYLIAFTAAARLEYRDAVNSVHYVHTINGLHIDISAGSLPTAEAATTFLHRSDLMN